MNHSYRKAWLCLFPALLSGAVCWADDLDSPEAKKLLAAPLVQVAADGSIPAGPAKPDVVGDPAFRKLSIERDDEHHRLVVSGVICSTNSGFDVQDAVVYVGYSNGFLRLAAISNMKGEVLFSASPTQATTSGKNAVATHLYVCHYFAGYSNPASKTILREYKIPQ